MDSIDYYKVLDIPTSAKPVAIKAAYRKLARKYHPDVNSGNKESEKKFKEINEANEVLSDPEKRRKYDELREGRKNAENFERANPGYTQRNTNTGQRFGGEDFSDFFGSMFGGKTGAGRRTKLKGQDLNAELHLTLTEVSRSQQQTITVNGKKIRLTFPAGIEDGQVIKIAGHGELGLNGGANGDLYIKFALENDTRFKREGKDLYTDVDLDLYTALLGGEVQIDTLNGKVKLKVSAQTQAGTKVRLKGKGFPVYKKENEFGDLFVTYQIKLPGSLTAKEIELFKELRQLRNSN